MEIWSPKRRDGYRLAEQRRYSNVLDKQLALEALDRANVETRSSFHVELRSVNISVIFACSCANSKVSLQTLAGESESESESPLSISKSQILFFSLRKCVAHYLDTL